MDRKRPRLFIRAAKTTPKEQLEYAAALLEEGCDGKAVRQYDSLVRKWPTSSEAAEAQLAVANIMEENGKHLRAFEEFQYLIEHYANRFPYEEALNHQFRIANMLMERRPKIFKFLAAPERALPLFKKIVKNAPNWKKTAEAQCYIGHIHELLGEYDEAVASYQVMLVKYPNDQLAAAAAFGRAKSLCAIATKRPRDKEQTAAAVLSLKRFVTKYRDSEDIQEAGERLKVYSEKLANMYYEPAEFYDTVAKRPKSAIIVYRDFLRRFPMSDKARTARKRIIELEKQIAEQDAE